MKRIQLIASQMKPDTISSRSIQASIFEQDSEEDRIYVLYCLQGNSVFKIFFNHMHYNVVDIINLYPSKKQAITQHFKLNSQAITIEPDKLWFSKINSLPDQKYHFIGSHMIKPKQIIQDFYDVWGKPFSIAIDLSHLTGDACLLNYIFDMNLNFEDNWKEVKKIKITFCLKKMERGILNGNNTLSNKTLLLPSLTIHIRKINFVVRDSQVTKKNCSNWSLLSTKKILVGHSHSSLSHK